VARTRGKPWIDSTAVAGNAYTYTMAAYDVAGNVSPASPAQPVTIYRAPMHVTVALASGHPQLSWDASTEIAGLASYAIYRSTNGILGTRLANTSATTWDDTFAQTGVTYTYGVRAYDAAGNMSAASLLVAIVAP